MKKQLNFWQICGFIFTGIAGVLLHFLYDWTDRSIIVSPVSAVNESIWEHMKLLFFPMFVFALIEQKYIGKNYRNFMGAKLAGILSGLVIIPTLYYTYTGALGVKADWFNITIFFIAAAAAYYLEKLILINRTGRGKTKPFALIVLILIAVIFVIFTFVQPDIPLFRDPITGKNGI